MGHGDGSGKPEMLPCEGFRTWLPGKYHSGKQQRVSGILEERKEI